MKKESLIRPCFSWKTQPPPAHWSMTCTQEVGLYKILPVGGAGVGVWGAYSSLPCPAPGLWGWGGNLPLWGEARHTGQQGQGSGLPLLEQEQKECWQVSWGPPQNKELDQDEMYPGLVTKCDGWLEGSGEILMCLPSSPRHTDFPCLLNQSLHSCLCRPKL